jgi:hypothetical protein
MFVRAATRRNKDGSAVRYLQLVHNEWDPASKTAKMRVLHNFGRKDQVDKAAIERLAGSLCRLLDPARAAAVREPGLSYQRSVAFGGPWLLDQRWRRLGIGSIMTARLAATRREESTERVLFALVANRALDPSCKLAASHWAGRKAWIDGLPQTSDDACYRAMDWLHQVKDPVEREVFGQVANLLNLEVDLLFFDTTSTYFEVDEEDEPVARDERGEPAPGGGGWRGPSRAGVPGLRKVQGPPRRPAPLIGEKLRSGSAEAQAALSRQGRYQDVTGNLRVKEVRIGEHERFVICYNPEAAERDAKVRARMLAQLEDLIKDSDKLTATKRAELRGVISAKPGLNRYLRVTPGGLLRTDAARVKAEENLDGKYLLRTSDPKLAAEDIALGYKQLLEVERGWRDLKQVIDLRPVYHRKEERIRAHVILCWLALLLIRIAETTTGTTWNKIADELGLLTLGTFTGPAGTFRQTAELTKTQRDLLAKLSLPHPKKIIEVTPATP